MKLGVDDITHLWDILRMVIADHLVHLVSIVSEGLTAMTIHDAKRIVRDLGFSLTRCDGEYRLAPYAGTNEQREAQAYYTPDIDDALGTAWSLATYRGNAHVYA